MFVFGFLIDMSFQHQEYQETERLTVKADGPEEPSESEKQEEKEEEQPFVVTEEPEEVEPAPLISTEDTGDLLVSCLYM